MAEKQADSVGIVEAKTIRVVENDNPLKLVSGKTLAPIDVVYETYGTLNSAGDNIVLICHALSGSAHAAGFSVADDKKPGWWDIMIGPGKAIDTYETALRANPTNAAATLGLARLYAGRGDIAKALDTAKNARKLSPDDPVVAYELGRLAFQTGDYPWATSLLEEAAA